MKAETTKDMKITKSTFMKNIGQLIAIILLVGMYACGQTSGAGEGGEEEHHDEHGGSGVSINKNQADMIGLELGKIEKKNLRNTIKVTGTLELFPQDRAEISPLIGGNIKSIHVVEGTDVKKGQLLATMQHPDFIQLQQDLIQRANMIENLKLEFERKERLFEENVSSAREFQQAKSDYFSAKSEIAGMKAKVKMLGLNVDKVLGGKIYETIPVTAPIKGSVHLINVNIGEFASPQMGRLQVMFEITDNSRLHVDLRVFEKDVHKIKIGQKVYFTVSSLSDKLLEAKIDAISKAFETNPKSVHVHASIDNPGGLLIPGAYVNGRIAISEKETFVVAETAVLSETGKSYVFVKVAGDGDEDELAFEKVEVYVGGADLGLIEIKNASDLPSGAQVVIKGAYTLSSEMVKGELGHDD